MKYEQLFIANSDKYENVKNSIKLYYEEKGILRLNTRISNVENFNFDKKFPILLRNDSHFTQLVILKVHKEHYRCPSRYTTSFKRLKEDKTTSATSYRRLIDVETTSCVYWGGINSMLAFIRYN